MAKIRKSFNDINKEIEAILEENTHEYIMEYIEKNKSKLIKERSDKSIWLNCSFNDKFKAEKLIELIDNLTGKELISKEHIQWRICYMLKAYVPKREYKLQSTEVVVLFSHQRLFNNSKLREKLNLSKIPKDKITYETILKNSVNYLFSEKPEKAFQEITEKIHLSRIKRRTELKNSINGKIENNLTNLEFMLSLDKEFNSTYKYFKKEKSVCVLLSEFLDDYVEDTLLDLIKKRHLNINYIIKFFDYDFDLKKNNDLLYEKLDRKIPRNSIQQALLKGLSKKEKNKSH